MRDGRTRPIMVYSTSLVIGTSSSLSAPCHPTSCYISASTTLINLTIMTINVTLDTRQKEFINTILNFSVKQALEELIYIN